MYAMPESKPQDPPRAAPNFDDSTGAIKEKVRCNWPYRRSRQVRQVIHALISTLKRNHAC